MSLLNFYSNDDSLVNPVNAELMAAYERGNPSQRTILIQREEHAYFYDRWGQQQAIPTYFHDLLPNTGSVTQNETERRDSELRGRSHHHLNAQFAKTRVPSNLPL